jgi:predicted aspartyl protease
MDKASREATAQEQGAPEEWIILPGTTVGGEVGTFYVDFVIWNHVRTQSRNLNGLVDTGASYTLIPASILEELSIERVQSKVFSLADGSKQELSIGWLEMELEGQTGNVYVVFGPDSGKILLGAMSLETFALAADAKYRCLIPAELTL